VTAPKRHLRLVREGATNTGRSSICLLDRPFLIGARRDAAVLALHQAHRRIDDLTLDLAKRAGVDTGARRLIQVLACFAPVLRALEHLTELDDPEVSPPGA
jgi:hypothetical protein